MKKRILSIILALVTLMGVMLLSSCGEHSTVNNAMENMRELEDVDFDVYIDATLQTGKWTKNYKLVNNVSVDGGVAVLTLGEYGGESQRVFISGNTAFFESDKTKTALSEYEKSAGSYEQYTKEMFFEFSKELFEDASKKESAGKLITKMTVKSEDAEEMTEGFVETIKSRLSYFSMCASCRSQEVYAQEAVCCASCELTYFDIGECAFEIYTKDGYVTEQTLEFTADFGTAGYDYVLTLKIKLCANNPGKNVSVSLPQDAGSYTLVKDMERKTLDQLCGGK